MLLNEIVNDKMQQKKEVDDIPAKPSALVCQKERVVEKTLPTPTPDIIVEVFQKKVLPKPSPGIVAEVFQEKEILPTSPPATEIYTNESVQRTKGDIVEYSDTNSETGESTRDESIDITDTHPNVKFYTSYSGRINREIHSPVKGIHATWENVDIGMNLCFYSITCYDKMA